MHRYAKVSKRVNIQRLKIDIWSNLSSQLPVEADPVRKLFVFFAFLTTFIFNSLRFPIFLFQATPPHRPPQQQLSFQEIITEIAGEDGGARQQDVTLPFYFICLLHLANEHVSILVSVAVSVDVSGYNRRTLHYHTLFPCY